MFEARDERLDQSVAVKTIRQSGDAEAHERFLREARAAAKVSHPHVCQIFEIGEHDGRPFSSWSCSPAGHSPSDWAKAHCW